LYAKPDSDERTSQGSLNVLDGAVRREIKDAMRTRETSSPEPHLELKLHSRGSCSSLDIARGRITRLGRNARAGEAGEQDHSRLPRRCTTVCLSRRVGKC